MPFINVMTNSEIKDKNALKSELGNAITAIPVTVTYSISPDFDKSVNAVNLLIDLR